ncbi:MAG: hypothetical protein P8Z80_15365 [Pseudolabrys sp.]
MIIDVSERLENAARVRTAAKPRVLRRDMMARRRRRTTGQVSLRAGPQFAGRSLEENGAPNRTKFEPE